MKHQKKLSPQQMAVVRLLGRLGSADRQDFYEHGIRLTSVRSLIHAGLVKYHVLHRSDSPSASFRYSLVGPYERLKDAHESNDGLCLSADDVAQLMRDTAIRDAVLQTWENEPNT